MATVRLDAYSKGYPLITNRIKASVLSSTSPFAVVASIIDTTAGHPSRIFTFLGLPRNNYGFSLDEIDGGGAVVNNLASFAVSPATIDGLLTRNDEQPVVGTTNGLDAGATSFTFDGTETAPSSGLFKPDYIGWEIVPSEIAGRGILVRGVDYSWDSTIAKFDLLIPGDAFNVGTVFNIHFEPVQNPAGNSYPTITDFEINLLTANTTLDESYFGKKIIVEPAGEYVEITLPDIATVVDGSKMMVEIGGAATACVKFIPQGSDVINFLRGNLFAMTNESFSIYKFTHPTNGVEWRVCEAEGNFKTVGRSVSDDAVIADTFNLLEFNGASISTEKYARLYNEFVLNLPLAQRVDYDSHATGNNKYLWSLANSADPGNSGKFLIPDRRNLFERNNQSGKAGDWSDWDLDLSAMKVTIPQGNSYTGAGGNGRVGRGNNNPNTFDVPVTITGIPGLETKPINYLINKYFLV